MSAVPAAGTLLAVGISAIVITTIVAVSRLAFNVIDRKKFDWDDGWLIAAYVVFVVVSSLYLMVSPTLYRLTDLVAGTIEMYPEVVDDGLKVQKVFFVTTSGLWICLWCVKFSLLAVYKKLLKSLSLYMKFWWIVVVICVLCLAGAITSSMMSCSSMSAWFTSGACNTPRDIRAAFISLWVAFAADIITDLLVMLLPLRLLRGLQMPLGKKLAIGGLFCLGWVCIIVSIVRATQLGQKPNEQISTQWLAIWGMTESAIAVIIGCGPGFYRRANSAHKSRKQYYARRSYIKADSSRHSTTYGHERGGIILQTLPQSRPTRDQDSSEEDLVIQGTGGLPKPQGIMVTRSIDVYSIGDHK